MTESAGRARLIAALIARAEEGCEGPVDALCYESLPDEPSTWCDPCRSQEAAKALAGQEPCERCGLSPSRVCIGCATFALDLQLHPQRLNEESLALRILQEQKDLEAHTRAVTDVDRLAQIRDTLLKH